jgi:predicted O-linked N-acetylglucosamine transferase (SPINDLY family)
MQKPFKRMPEFDKMLIAIMNGDPKARLLLHDVESSSNRKIMKSRLARGGADMRRVHFLPTQPHHKLLSLYSLSDVVLDSYPASG